MSLPLASSVQRQTRKVTVVLPTNFVELREDLLLWLSPDSARPGQIVEVLERNGDFAVWSTSALPALLGVHSEVSGLAPGVYRRRMSHARSDDSGLRPLQ